MAQPLPQAAWIVQAQLGLLTQNPETGKTLNVALWVAGQMMLFSLLRSQGWTRIGAAGAGVLVGASPVVLSQFWTFYNDGLLGSALLLLSLFLAKALLQDEKRPTTHLFLGLTTSLTFLVGVKFTGLAMGMIVIAFTLGMALLVMPRNRIKPLLLLLAGATTVALLLALEPYLTNTLEKGHPFWPVRGPDSVDIMKGLMRPVLQEQPNAVFRTWVGWTGLVPFEPIQIGEILGQTRQAGHYDVRVSGFSPLLPLLALVGMMGWIHGRRVQPELVKALGIVSLALFVAAIAHPESWWSRFVPQVWTAAMMGTVFFFHPQTPKTHKPVAMLLVLIGGLLTTTWLHHSLRRSVWDQRAQNQQISTLLNTQTHIHVQQNTDWQGTLRRFERRGVVIHRYTTLACANEVLLQGVDLSRNICLEPAGTSNSENNRP